MRRRLTKSFVLILPELALAALIVVAVLLAREATNLIEWPHDPDLYRDIASAQKFLDCHCLADPLYRGETIWYNPLVPALVALISAVSRVPVHVLYVRLGPLLNVLPVVGFYALTRFTFDRLTAAVATFAFVFLVNPGTPAWGSATYSAWLFAGVFSQAFFYTSVAIYARARLAEGMLWTIVVGFALGVTFLAHTAPALILGAILIIGAAWSTAPLRTRALRLVIQLGTAVIVSVPLLYSIVGRYHLRWLNPMPSTWLYLARPADMMPSIPLGSLLITGPLLIIGTIGAALDPHMRRRTNTIWLWAFANLGWVGYNTIARARPFPFDLPVYIPSFHFEFYLRALSCMFAAYGAVRIIRAIAAKLERRTDQRAESALASVLAVVMLAGAYRTVRGDYAARHDLTTARFAAWRMSRRSAEKVAFDWIRSETRPGDVFLASEHLGQYLIGPAGGDVIVVDPFFSNPFVDFVARKSESNQLWEAVRHGDRSRFQSLASKYGLRYVMVDDVSIANEIDRASACFLHKRWEIGAIRVYDLDSRALPHDGSDCSSAPAVSMNPVTYDRELQNIRADGSSADNSDWFVRGTLSMTDRAVHVQPLLH
jgi:hypothetical protein